jgi:hypothetical protein
MQTPPPQYSLSCRPPRRTPLSVTRRPCFGRGQVEALHSSGQSPVLPGRACARMQARPAQTSVPVHAHSHARTQASAHNYAADRFLVMQSPTLERTCVPIPTRATTHTPAWRGQGRAFGSLSRLTSPALRPATECGLAARGNPSAPEARASTRSRSRAPALAHARANLVVVLHTSSEIEAPSSRPTRRSTSPLCRGHPSAWAHERQTKSVHVFLHTHARRRTPRRATVELAAVAKPPTCLRAELRTWTPPLSGQMLTATHASSPHTSETESQPSTCCGVRTSLFDPRCTTLSARSLTHTRVKASPFYGQTSCELKPLPPAFLSSPGTCFHYTTMFSRELFLADRHSHAHQFEPSPGHFVRTRAAPFTRRRARRPCRDRAAIWSL